MEKYSDGKRSGTLLSRLQRFRSALAMVVSAVALAALGYVPPALAAGSPPPAFTIVGPQEWDLPIVKPGHGVTAIIQTGIYSSGNQTFNANGNLKAANPKGHIFLGLTRVAHLFSFASMPNVGFFWEYLQPEVRVANNDGTSASGLGDPLIDGTVYFRPMKNLMVGFQNIVSIPVGNNNLTNNFWEYDPDFIADYTWGRFGVDNTVGVGLKSTYVNGGQKADEGDDFYEDLRLRYRLNHYLKPFVSFDYARTYGGHYTYGPNAGTNIPSSYQDIGGAGTLIYLRQNQTAWLDVWYNAGFAGRNATRVNGVFTRLVFLL